MGIFEPFRAIGYITSSVPFSVVRLGTETFVTVSVGKSWQIYNCAKLSLVLVGPQLPKKIRAIASYRDYTFAAYGSNIGVFKRAHQVGKWCHNAKVNSLLLFGEHVLSVDSDGKILIWAFKGLDDQNILPSGQMFLEEKFSPSCLMHPDTYLNKVLVGSHEGSLQLWNISTKKKIYEFKGWDSSVCCCVSSPALDVVAVGCADGKIHVYNIRYDEEIVTFTHSTRGAVTALSFSTDGQPFLASGSSSGVISIWNLEKRRLQCVIKEAHDSSVASLHFFANEPVLMSASADNSLKMWIFDTNDGDPRLLRFRSGHSAPPLCIRFYANGRHILSAGQDRAFRLFSVIQDQQSRELSQRHVTKRAKKIKLKEEDIKLKPVIAFDVAEIRERDWCNVVTCHMDTAQAYVWRLQNFVLGEHILTPEHQTPIKCCAISACGNFGVIGTSGGWIERFNLQSGASRGSYIDLEEGNCAHLSQVVGVACDSTNTLMISAGYNGDVKVWDFKGREVKSRWDVGCALVKIVYHRANGLVATVADDLIIRLYDVVAQRMVRIFEGHSDRITDACFSEDGKWLISSSMDGTLRIWDVILAKQIDAINVDVSVTALSLSPNLDVLATTHVDHNGVYLWVNKAMFSGVDIYGSGTEVVSVKLPSVSSTEGPTECTTESDAKADVRYNTSTDIASNSNTIVTLLEQQIPDLITLSLLPKSQWKGLINLDIIKERNKPIEAPKKGDKVPFFLPSIPSLSGDILFKPIEPTNEEKILQTSTESENNTTKSHIPASQFLQYLHSSADTDNFEGFSDYVKTLSSSTLDMELRMLQIIDDDEDQEDEKRHELYSIELLLDYFIHEITRRNDYEFIQALVRLFLKIHGETIRRQEKIQEKARKLLEIHCGVWQRLDGLLQSGRCKLTFLSNA
jgi:U3 small nucleolar RNA-associated protein 21